MIACLDQRRRLSHSGVESPPPAVAAAASDPDLLPGDADPSAAADFGGMVRNRPAAIIRPTTTDAVSRAIRLASRSDRLTVAARGNGHSIHGQAMADGGIVLDMRSLATVARMDLVWSPSGAPLADVPGGALWEEVLYWGINTHGLAPASWTDYLGLTVGGTLSNGGISGQAFRVGPQVSNVAELEVVTGDGERRVCSPAANPDLFFAALGGLGQFGVITRARIPLHPAPDMVKWMRVVYALFEDYAGDAERLVSRTGGLVDYVEGFSFINREDDPVNGWGSVPLRNGSVLDRSRVPPAAGPVLYCLEVALHYDRGEEAAVDERAAGILRTLRYVRGLEFAEEVSYSGFLTRVNRAEEEARANGSWNAPHPWLNLLVSRADIADFDRHVFKQILRDGVGGPMLVYPLLKSKWDPRATAALPESEVFYLVALLRFGRPSPEEKAAAAVEQMVVQNREIVDWCDARGYDYKVYLPHYETEEGWARHFGRRGWARFMERKATYDPLAILAPGHNIFSRSRPPPPLPAAEAVVSGGGIQ